MSHRFQVVAILAFLLLLVGACMRERTIRRTGFAETPQERMPTSVGYDFEVREAGDSVEGLKKLAVGPVSDPNDRDLGPGADGEKLGSRQQADPGNGERYAPVTDNRFVRLGEAGGDASTFGLDVDSASFANCRRFISEMRRLPPPAAVRIEELLNSFAYTYPAPAAGSDVPFAATTTVAACPWAPAHRLVRVALRARSIDPAHRPPLNLIFLVDTSGSMSDANKLPLVQRALLLLAEQLDARDRLAIVTYAGEVGTALGSTAGDQQERIRRAIHNLRSGGSTNGAGGIRAAYDVAAAGVAPGTVSRVMLCTDGDFNVGISDPAELRRLVEERRNDGVQLNTYGFGMGNYKDDTLEVLADHGNGIYGYIDSYDEARRLFDAGAMGQLVTVAKDAKAQIFFNPAAVAAWRLIGYENRVLRREDFNDDRIDAGDIGAGHTVTALYEIVPRGGAVPDGDANPFIGNESRPAIADADVLMRLRLRYKQPAGGASRLLEQDVAAEAVAMDADFHFAAAVAGFGMLLRHSPWLGQCNWSMVSHLAKAGLEGDRDGQRKAFVELVAKTRGMAP